MLRRDIADRLQSLVVNRFREEQPERELTISELENIWYIIYGKLCHGETEKEVEELAEQGIEVIREQYHLDAEEEIALKQIDAMKNELVNIYRFKQANGADRFDLAPDKANKLNDDRAYVAAMGAWVLQQLRREPLLKKKSTETDIDKFFEIRTAKKAHSYFS